MTTFAERFAGLTEVRATRPGEIARLAAARARYSGDFDRLMIIAADHPARNALGAGGDALAMADRRVLLERLCAALARPGVNGLLATPDLVEDLLLLGALDGKLVLGSMNRGGLAGSAFELDDRFTGYTAAAIGSAGLDGGKMLLRIDPADPASVMTLEACGRTVTELAERNLMAMVEPFWSHRVDGRVANLLTPEAMIRAISVASGLGATSAHTWLKVPVVADMERVMAASTLPALLLGGEVPADPEAALTGWQSALKLPTVRGLVVGRSLLYPADGDVAGAVDAAVAVLP